MPNHRETKDCYKVLGVPRNATKDEIRVAYKKMALKWHPDRHMTDKENASQKFIEIHDAYKTLAIRRERCRSHHPRHSGEGRKWPGNPSSSKPSPQPSGPYTSSHSSSSESRSRSRQSSPDVNSDFTDSTSPKSARHTSKHPRSRRSHPTSFSSPRSSSESSSPLSSPSSSSLLYTSSSDSANPYTAPHSSSKPEFHWARPQSPPAQHPLSEAANGAKSTRAKLRKQPRPRPQMPMPKKRKTDHGSANDKLGSDSDDFVHVSDASFPPATWGPKCKGKKKENESKFSIKLTLEDFFHGTRHRYRFTRYLLSGKRKTVILNVDIPPGCRPGTKIFYPGVGHERPDGSLQDVVIIIEQVPHERFGREKNDLVLDVDLLWMKTLQAEKAEIVLEGLNGESFEFVINYPVDKSTRGRYVFSGGGMPIRQGRSVVGRGDLIVRWEILSPSVSKWDTLKKALHFDR